jgi:N-acetylmuramic acid 6-phosphate (MurNAc-6-P) etherase
VKIVAALAGVELEVARRTLEDAGLIKIAVVMLKRGMSKAEAVAALDAAGGNVRKALQ